MSLHQERVRNDQPGRELWHLLDGERLCAAIEVFLHPEGVTATAYVKGVSQSFGTYGTGPADVWDQAYRWAEALIRKG